MNSFPYNPNNFHQSDVFAVVMTVGLSIGESVLQNQVSAITTNRLSPSFAVETVAVS